MTHTIADVNLDRLTKKANALIRKAKSLGQSVSFRIGEPTYIETTMKGATVRYPAHSVELDGHIGINGWSFVAKIMHTEGGNLLLSAPDMKCPESYRDAKPICEHCHTTHHRKETFVIVNEDGEYKQVGRDCLRLYTDGLDAELCATFLDCALEIEDMDGNVGGCGDWGYDPEIMVSACLANVEEDGYDRERIDGQVGQSIHWRKDCGRPCAEDYLKANEAKVKAVIESALNSPECSDYMENVKVAFRMTAIPMKLVRIVASYCAKYLRDQKRALATAKRATESKHVGQVGERITFKVRVTDGKAYRVLFTSSHQIAWNTYSYTYVVELIDTDGNVYKWNASNLSAFDEASENGATELTVKATVKAHGEYKGVKQTVVTRATII